MTENPNPTPPNQTPPKPTPPTWLSVFLIYNNILYDSDHINDPNNKYISIQTETDSLYQSLKDIPFDLRCKIIIVQVRVFFTPKHGTPTGLFQSITVSEKFDTPVKNDRINPSAKVTVPPAIDTLVAEDAVKNVLTQVFEAYPADRRMVITFGHGSVLGINMMPLLQPLQYSLMHPKKDEDPDKNTDDSPDDKDGMPIGNDDCSGLGNLSALTSQGLEQYFLKHNLNLLSNVSFARAITGALGAVGVAKLDLLVMFNCLMQNIFTQYEFRDCVDYLVAPVSGISYPAYDWVDVFTQIINNQNASNSVDYSNRDIAGLFLSNTGIIARGKAHRSHPHYEDEIINTWKLNAIQLDKALFEKIQQAFAAFLTSLSNQAVKQQLYICLSVVQRQLLKYNSYCLPSVMIVDLYVLTKYLPSMIKQLGYKNTSQEIDDVYNKCMQLNNILAQVDSQVYFGDKFYNSDSGYYYIDCATEFKYENNKGIGFWFPEIMQNCDLLMDILNQKSPVWQPSFVTDTPGFVQFFSDFASWGSPIIA